MKLSHPVDVCFRDFVLHGKFDYVEPGQSKAWLSQHFPDPDSRNNMGHGLSIWLYGHLEFHFDDEQLFMIWCDNLDPVDSGDSIRLEKWILNDYATQNLTTVFNTLIGERVDMQVVHQSPNTALLHINPSRVTLWFETDDDSDPAGQKAYLLRAFSLIHRDYETRFR